MGSRDESLSKSEAIRGEICEIPRCSGPPANGEKGRKKREKEKAGETSLKTPFVTPPSLPAAK